MQLIEDIQADPADAFLIPAGPVPLADLGFWLHEWAHCWKVPELPDHTHLMYSARLSEPLGRSRPALGEIVLNGPFLRAHPEMLEIALCHHAAHLAVYLLYGPRVPAHGIQWRHLMRRAGYPAEPFC